MGSWPVAPRAGTAAARSWRPAGPRTSSRRRAATPGGAGRRCPPAATPSASRARKRRSDFLSDVMGLRTAALRPLIDWPRPLDLIPADLSHFVIAGLYPTNHPLRKEFLRTLLHHPKSQIPDSSRLKRTT